MINAVIDESGKIILYIIFLLVSNMGTVITIIGVYTSVIRKQQKIEFLLKRVCDKLQISTDTTI